MIEALGRFTRGDDELRPRGDMGHGW